MKNILLLNKEIIIDKCERVFYAAPGDDWQEHFMVMRGSWEKDGDRLVGAFRENRGGILFTRKSYPDGYMMRCKMGTVLPATRDVNCIFCGHWIEDTNKLGPAYVCGLNGWYDHKSGIERNDNPLMKALTNSYVYTPGAEVEMCVGAIGGHTFMVVDDELVCEYIDPTPLTDGHFGFSPYCTKLFVHDIEIMKIAYIEKDQYYDPEF